MTKVLDLDALETTIDKVIKVKGVEHRMTPFSVESFVNQMKEIEDLANTDLGPVETYNKSLQMILRAFPTLPEEVLRGLGVHQVDAIYSFLRERTDEAQDEAKTLGNSEGETA